MNFAAGAVGQIQKDAVLFSFPSKSKKYAEMGVSKVKIIIGLGDLLQEKGDCIVNPANSFLQNSGGVAKLIADAAGPAFTSECTKFILQNSKLLPGKAELMSAHKLQNFKYIISATAPMWKKEEEEKIFETLSMTTRSILEKADSMKLRSIVMPSIGTGIFQIPPEHAAKAIISSMIGYMLDHPSSSVQLIQIIDNNLSVVRQFKEKMENISISFSKQDGSTNISSQNDFSNLVAAATWSWQENDGSFVDYDSDQNIQIERAYQIFLVTRVPSKVTVVGDRVKLKNGFTYDVFFPEMQQKNTKTGKLRNIRRIRRSKEELEKEIANVRSILAPKSLFSTESGDSSILAKARKATIFFNDLEKKDVLKCFMWGVRSDVSQAKKQLSQKIEAALRKTDFKSKKPVGPELEKKLIEIAQGNMVDLVRLSETKYEISGIGELVHQTKADLQEALMEELEKLTSDKYPEEWGPQSKPIEEFDVPRDSEQWKTIAQKMVKTLPNVIIERIQRIQNKSLWNHYHSHKMAKLEIDGAIDLKRQANEMLLFHGSKQTPPESIYKGSGFDPRFSSTRSMWGTGAYFAENAVYSNGYASSAFVNKKQIFLALVNVGNSIQLSPDSTLRLPPVIPGSSSDSTQRYDSVNGITGNSRVYIVYEPYMAYPSYLITYQVTN